MIRIRSVAGEGGCFASHGGQQSLLVATELQAQMVYMHGDHLISQCLVSQYLMIPT